MQIRFLTCDVFTETQFGGNQLAVVPDGSGLTGAQMQAIAREFNYSETTFVLPPKDPANTAHVRIFTPMAELPFAGHPNVGTAVILAQLGLTGDAETTIFEEGAGLVPIDLIRTPDGTVTGATLTAPVVPVIGPTVPTAPVVAAVGLAAGDVKTDRHGPVVVSAGVEFLFTELTDPAALARSRPGARGPDLEGLNMTGTFFYTASKDDGVDIRARMFAPEHNIPEDPATGSAAAALAGLLGSFETEDGAFTWIIDQGVEMGRPSRLTAKAFRENGRVVKVTVGGTAVPVAEGTLTLR